MSALFGSFVSKVETMRRSARFERFRARAPRYLFAGATVVLSLVGARELFFAETGAESRGAARSVDHAGEDFAQRFARAYLTYDAARPAIRERALGQLTPDDLLPDAGLLARGAQSVEWTRVAENQEAIAGGRVIVVAAGVSTQTAPIYLAVPVHRAADGAVGLGEYPSLIGPPPVSHAAPADREDVEQREIVAVARRVVANYLAGEAQNLAADLAPQTEVSLPKPALRLLAVEDVVWARGVGSSAVLVTVLARDASRTTWTLTYELGIDRRGGRSYVTFVETVPNAP